MDSEMELDNNNSLLDKVLEKVGEPLESQLLEPDFGPPPPSITFDDVLIVPAYSEIESRADIDTSVEFLGQSLGIPIVSANMDYITGTEMVKAMTKAGGMGILHRFAPWEEQLSMMDSLDKENVPFWFSVGIRNTDESFESVIQVNDSFANFNGVCIDVAHGHHKKVGELITRIKREKNTIKIIAGNIATADGAKFLIDAGADVLKVGIGAGSVCTTRTVAGIGIPQLSAILEVASSTQNMPIIADGGIRGSADLFKALIAGARLVMIGSLLAGTKECPSPVIHGSDGRNYRPYRGQSIFGTNGERYVKEGIEGYVEEKGPAADILYNLQAGLRSGMSYIGASTIKEISEKGKFTLVSYHTQAENQTRVRQVI